MVLLHLDTLVDWGSVLIHADLPSRHLLCDICPEHPLDIQGGAPAPSLKIQLAATTLPILEVHAGGYYGEFAPGVSELPATHVDRHPSVGPGFLPFRPV